MSYAPSQLQAWFDEQQDVVYAIETNSFATLSLYREFAMTKKVVWEEVTRGGPMVTVGKIDDRPICVTFNVCRINGKKVVMYDATSQLVDWAMVEAYIEKQFPKLYPEDGRRQQGDAGDFWNCIQYIKSLNEPVAF